MSAAPTSEVPRKVGFSRRIVSIPGGASEMSRKVGFGLRLKPQASADMSAAPTSEVSRKVGFSRRIVISLGF